MNLPNMRHASVPGSRWVWMLCIWAGFCGAAAGDDRILIHLKSKTTIRHGIVRIEDVADVSGTNLPLRRRIAHLDLDEFEDAPATLEIRRSRIDLRLQLAGVETQQYRLHGPGTTIVNRRHQSVDDDTVVEAVREPLAKAWSVPVESLAIRLEKPLTRILPRGFSLPDDAELSPFVPPSSHPGKLRMTIGVYQAGRLIETFVAPLSVYVEQLAAIARRPLRIGHRVTIEDVSLVRQRRVGTLALQTVGQDAIGQFVTQPIRTTQLLTVRDVSPAAPEQVATAPRESAAERQRVRSRTPVILVAKRGPLRVVVHSAELISDAFVGDAVRVKNLDSNRVVAGRLISPSEVEVRF